MKLKEIFARHGVEADEKARRVLNTSTGNANLTASDVEEGVTLERLAEIGVPVFKYSTQITIHGVLPGFSPEARPAGFKSVFANKNGTMGVRYVAVDGAKKKTIVDVSHLSPDRLWTASINSAGLSLTRRFDDREECIAAFKGFPRDLICGSVIAGAGPFGGFFVIADVGAIPAAGFWHLTEALWGIRSEEQFKALDSERVAEFAKRRKEADERQAAWKAKAAEARAEIAAAVTFSRLAQVKIAPGTFLRINEGVTQRPRLIRYLLKKRGVRLCYQIVELSGESSGKWHPITPEFSKKIQDECAKGFIFADQAA